MLGVAILNTRRRLQNPATPLLCT